jgi:UDP-N-acetylmuramoyl-tripeptide--D-alanyl-D-alanine ligase
MVLLVNAPTTPPAHDPALFWNIDRIGRALADRLAYHTPSGDTSIGAISTDTRTIAPGDCFVALAGEAYDAHDFLDVAVRAGAAALVVSRPVPLHQFSVPIFLVDDTLVALGDLARYRRIAWGKPVVGIAGSNGKTSTKELVRAALGATYTVHATTGNLNNRIGVPLTLLALPDDADIAVVEMGTSLPGEVATLREIVRPDIVAITSIGEEHLEGLGDLDGVFREELSACDGVSLAITPSAQPEVAASARERARQVIDAGLDAGDMRAASWNVDTEGRATIVLTDEHGMSVTVNPPVRGVHNARNAMLAIAIARACGVPDAHVARGIASMPVPSMRAAWHTIGGATIINDAYNANPGSARAALEMLASSSGSQRVAVLGTMRELGPNAARYHDEVSQAALASPADLIAGIGEFADALQRVAAGDPRVVTAPDVDELWTLLEPRLSRDAVVLLKASRGVKLERILPHLTAWAEGSC